MRNLLDKLTIAKDLIRFLWDQRLWWAIPSVMVMLIFGIIVVIGSSSGVGPFIYTLF
ncbi:DUF5989 family protein [Dehalococcoidia bacterium]|nr:DUF5989 family protein [Dehalococcoidia bacterium]